MSWARYEKDPFRLFFPLGAALAVAGVSPWLLPAFGHATYPRDLHRALMVNGFLLSFVCGFLMTAITRFTGTHFATRGEILGVLSSILLASAGAYASRQGWSFVFASLALVFLMRFALSRFVRKTSNPPYTFVFIGVGLLLWLAANLGQAALAFGWSAPEGAPALFGELFSQGAILSLILGVGGRLIPGILGWDEIVVAQRQRYEKNEPFLSLIPADVWASVLLFVATFLAGPWLPPAARYLGREAVALHFALRYWRLHRAPKQRSYLTWSLWLSGWCLALGYLVPAFWPGGGAHALHLLFVGGFSLITLLISARVSFAHGPGTEVEKSAGGLLLFAFFVLIAAITRVLAVLWPASFLALLSLAAAFWLAGLAIWAFTVVTKCRSA